MNEVFCPRCDRAFTGRNAKESIDKVVDHVKRAHPDYDPNWYKD